jgi:hypothetical protein
VQGLRSAGVRFAYANGCTISFYRCHAYANGCTISFYRCHAYANDNAHSNTHSGESICYAKTCNGEYFYGERSSSECSRNQPNLDSRF